MTMRVSGAAKAAALCLAIAALASCSTGNGLTRSYTQGGDSMEPALHKGQTISAEAVGSHGYIPHRGDIIVFKAPPGWLDPSNAGPCDCMTKRVIGIPGDKVSSQGQGAPVEVNGAVLSEPYVYPGDVPSWQEFSATVPPGDLWVMGDHREVSQDSRAHHAMDGTGFVPVANVLAVYHQG
jgi:signal peptidase I